MLIQIFVRVKVETLKFHTHKDSHPYHALPSLIGRDSSPSLGINSFEKRWVPVENYDKNYIIHGLLESDARGAQAGRDDGHRAP